MNSLIFCLFLCISSSTGLLPYFCAKSTPNIVCRRHEFIYSRGDYFRIFIGFVGRYTSAGVTRSKAVVRLMNKEMVREQFGSTGIVYEFEFYLEHDKITIDVELTKGGVCERFRVLEGTEMSALPEGANDTAYSSEINGICLSGRTCFLYMNAAEICKDKKLRPLPCNGERDPATHTPTEKHLFNPESRTAAKNITAISSPSDNAKEDAEFQCNTYFTIMIVTSITSAVALILLLIIAIRQRFWMKSNPPHIPLTSSSNNNRYYENVVFRLERRPEDEQQEQRVYDVPSTENTYDEVNSHRAQLN